MPRGSKVAKAEKGIRATAKKKYASKERQDKMVYGTLNKLGMMKGSKVTAKGKAKASPSRRKKK